MSEVPPLTRAILALAGAYLALVLFSWPVLPLNMHLADVLLPLLAVALIVERRPSGEIRMKRLDWAVVVVAVAPLPSLLVTPDVSTSAIAEAKRLYVGAVFVVFAVCFKRHGSRGLLLVLVRAAAVTCAICLLAAVVYMLTGQTAPLIGLPNPLPYVGTVLRVWGGADSAEMFGNYLTVVWPVAFAFAIESRARLRWTLILVLLLAGMVLSFSHAVGGFAVAALVAAWPLLTTGGWRAGRILGAAAVIALVVLVNLMLTITVRDVRWVQDRDSDVPTADYVYAFQPPEGANRVAVAVSYNPMSYFLLKQVAWRAFLVAPWTGTGLGTFHRVTGRAYEAGILHRPYRAIDPHSTVFGALAETGVGGAAAAALLFAAALTLKPRPDAPAWLVRALKGGVLGVAVNSLNADVLNFRFLWIALAALRALV